MHGVNGAVANLTGLSARQTQKSPDPCELGIQAGAKRHIAWSTAADEAEGGAQRSIGHCQISPSDHPIMPQQRQRVIAELALGRGGVGLEAIRPAPEDLEAAAVPCDGIEGGEQAYAVVGPPAHRGR